MNKDNLLNSLMKRLESSVSILKLASLEAISTDNGDIFVDGEIAEGTVVYSDENGTAAADGDYTLEDGTVITIAGGSITAISDNSELTSPVEEMDKEKLADAATAPTDAPATSPDLTHLQSDVETLKAQVAQMMEVLSASTTCTEQLTSENKSLKEKVEKLSAQPATTSIKSKAMGFTAESANSLVENARLALSKNKK